MAPIIIKVLSQPQLTAIHGTVKGAKMAPTLDPELNTPVASERSFFGKYSATALMAAGKFQASPIARNDLEIMKPKMETGTAAIPTQTKMLLAAVPIGIE